MPWGYVLEDYLSAIGHSLDEFMTRLAGGWMFGYAAALRRVGVETVVIAVTEGVRRTVRGTHAPSGTEVCLVPPTPMLRQLRHRGVIYPAQTTTRGASRTGDLTRAVGRYLGTGALPIVRTAKQLGCEALMCQEYEHPRFDSCVAVGRTLGVRVYATFQGGGRPETALERVIRPYAVRASHGLVIASAREAERVRSEYRLPQDRIARVFNPLDLAAWRPVARDDARQDLGLPPEAVIVAWHGRVAMHRKGLDVLVDAWERVHDADSDQERRLLLVGSGSDARELRSSITRRGMHGILWVDEFVLDRQRLAKLLSAADVYVLPSRWEGFPVAAIEAMACGLPLVASDAPGIAEILEGGEATGGVVVPPGNAEALARALDRLLRDKPLRDRLGERARTRALTAFSLEDVGNQLRKLLFAR